MDRHETAIERKSRALASTSFGSWRLTPLRQSDGGMRVVIVGDPLRRELQEVLGRYEHAAKPAELSVLLRALATLAAVTVRQEEIDHAAAVEATRVYAETLSRFPGDIALGVIASWPERQNGKWWPSLNELIAACREANAERIAAQDSLRAALRTARPGDDGAGPHPQGATQRFVERVIAARGPAYGYSWLNRRNCRFTPSQVLTTRFIAETLHRDCGPIAEDCGVEILQGARYACDDDRGDAEPAPIVRLFQSRTEEPTDEERAEGARLLRDLLRSMRR